MVDLLQITDPRYEKSGREGRDDLLSNVSTDATAARQRELKVFLEIKEKKGLDSKKIYENELKLRPANWAPAPSYDEILNPYHMGAETWEVPPTTSERQAILIVDDEILIHEFLSELLAEEYDLLFAEDHQSVIKCFEQNRERIAE